MFDKGQLMLRCIDFPAKEGDACSVLLCRTQEFKCVIGGSCGSSEYANDQRRIIGTDLFHGGRAKVGNLQELGPGHRGYARKQANDMVVQKGWNSCLRDTMHISGNLRAEHPQKMLTSLRFRLPTKDFI